MTIWIHLLSIKTRCPRLKINVRKQIFQRLVFVLFLCDNLPDILYSQVSQKWLEGGGDRKNHALHNYYLTSLCVPSALHYSRGFLTMVVVSHTLTLKTSPFCTFCSAIGHRKGKPWSVGHVYMDTKKLFDKYFYLIW